MELPDVDGGLEPRDIFVADSNLGKDRSQMKDRAHDRDLNSDRDSDWGADMTKSTCSTPFDEELPLIHVPSSGNEIFVSPTGNNQAEGLRETPLKSVGRAIEKANSGDQIVLREGVYYEHLTIKKKGDKANWITIKAYKDEKVEIDGGIPDFREAGNWELVDRKRAIYKSKKSYPKGKVFGAWMIDKDAQLIQYDVKENFTSSFFGPLEGMKAVYMGPGIQHRSDGYFYIRLQENPRDLIAHDGAELEPAFVELDPNQHRIAIYTSQTLIYMTDSAFIRFQNIGFGSASYIFDILGENRHIIYDRCRFRVGRYGLLIREGIDELQIRNSRFSAGLMRNVFWTDVKNRYSPYENPHEAYPEFQGNTISGAMRNTKIQGNHFTKSFDGMTISDTSKNVKVSGNFFSDLRDDAINVFAGSDEIEISYNLVRRSATGFSPLASITQEAHLGEVYIHHNVIDNSGYQHIGREGNARSGYPLWSVLDPFGAHSGKSKGKLKVYQNTIVTRRSGKYAGANPYNMVGNSSLYVYDNIFFSLDHRPLHRYHEAKSGAKYDGNVNWQTKKDKKNPMFLEFGDGKSHASLEDFRKNSGTDWEIRGLEIHPGYDISDLRREGNANPSELWKRYTPTEDAIFIKGASDPNWVGGGMDYRGAIGCRKPPLQKSTKIAP